MYLYYKRIYDTCHMYMYISHIRRIINLTTANFALDKIRWYGDFVIELTYKLAIRISHDDGTKTRLFGVVHCWRTGVYFIFDFFFFFYYIALELPPDRPRRYGRPKRTKVRAVRFQFEHRLLPTIHMAGIQCVLYTIFTCTQI